MPNAAPSTHFVHAVQLQDNGKIIIPDEAAESIKIDGVLNENIWGLPPITREFISFFPLFGEKLDQIIDPGWAAKLSSALRANKRLRRSHHPPLSIPPFNQKENEPINQTGK